jgi:glutamyl-Q tRNA(Asp) synthetase
MPSLQMLQNFNKPLINRPHTSYRGRFAPSPSGFLHFGSLVAALASFLQAKSIQGQWLVRIEDIDPPREKPGADVAILKTLEAYGMHWDEEVLYQSKHSELYVEVLSYLKSSALSYNCQCTRGQIKQTGGIYQSTCKDLCLPEGNTATRLINNFPFAEFNDLLQGRVSVNKELAGEDFIIHRRDGLFAYQLAVVVDDIFQGITEVVRGCDLLEPTARQLTLFSTLKYTPPKYLHIPLAVTDAGYKLSKQNSAPAIDNQNPQPALIHALQFLGQKPPIDLLNESVDNIINWAIKHWQVQSIPHKREISL